MDPTAIIGAATLAASGALAICKLCSDAKHVNQAVRDLASEAQAVGDACDMVAKRLRSIIEEADAVNSPTEKMKSLIDSRITACQGTLSQLTQSLYGLDNASLTFLEKLRNQIRLNLRTADIAEARTQLRSHTEMLQLTLHVLSIEVGYLIPHKADQRLCSLVAKVEQYMEILLVAKAKNDHAAQKPTDEDELIRYTRETLTVADDLYRESQANGSIGSPHTEERIREIEGWALEVCESTPALNIGQNRMPFGNDRILSDADSPLKRRRKSVIDIPLQLELAKAALGAAISTYRSGDFDGCMAHMKKRSEIVSKLPESETVECNNEEVQFRLEMVRESLQARNGSLTSSQIGVFEEQVRRAEILIRPLPTDLQEEYWADERHVRVELAKLILEDARDSFAKDKYNETESWFLAFERLLEPLTKDLVGMLRKEESTVRMDMAQAALGRAQGKFKDGHVAACWEIFNARTVIVRRLPDTQKTSCKAEEYQCLQLLARELLDRATASESGGDYAQCLSHLQLRESILKRAPIEQDDDRDVLKPIYLQAISNHYTVAQNSVQKRIKTLLEASEAFESRLSDLTDHLQQDRHHLSFLIAQQYLEMYLSKQHLETTDLDEARHYCSVALAGFRKVPGASGTHLAVCHALLSCIREMQGEHMEATYHTALIPEDQLNSPPVKRLLEVKANSSRKDSSHDQQRSAMGPKILDRTPKYDSPIGLRSAVVIQEPILGVGCTSLPISGQQKPELRLVSEEEVETDEQPMTPPTQTMALTLDYSTLAIRLADKTPTCIKLYCEHGCLTLERKVILPKIYTNKSPEQVMKGYQLGLSFWSEMIRVLRLNIKQPHFSRHFTGMEHMGHVPSIGLYVHESKKREKSYLTLESGCVPIVSQRIQWAQLVGAEEADKVIEKIKSAVTRGYLRKSKAVTVTEVQYEYTESTISSV